MGRPRQSPHGRNVRLKVSLQPGHACHRVSKYLIAYLQLKEHNYLFYGDKYIFHTGIHEKSSHRTRVNGIASSDLI